MTVPRWLVVALAGVAVLALVYRHAVALDDGETPEQTPAPRKRGRPRKAKPAPTPEPTPEPEPEPIPEPTPAVVTIDPALTGSGA